MTISIRVCGRNNLWYSPTSGATNRARAAQESWYSWLLYQQTLSERRIEEVEFGELAPNVTAQAAWPIRYSYTVAQNVIKVLLSFCVSNTVFFSLNDLKIIWWHSNQLLRKCQSIFFSEWCFFFEAEGWYSSSVRMCTPCIMLCCTTECHLLKQEVICWHKNSSFNFVRCSISWSGQCMLILYSRPALLAGNVCDIVDYCVVQSIFCFYLSSICLWFTITMVLLYFTSPQVGVLWNTPLLWSWQETGAGFSARDNSSGTVSMKKIGKLWNLLFVFRVSQNFLKQGIALIFLGSYLWMD